LTAPLSLTFCCSTEDYRIVYACFSISKKQAADRVASLCFCCHKNLPDACGTGQTCLLRPMVAKVEKLKNNFEYNWWQRQWQYKVTII